MHCILTGVQIIIVIVQVQFASRIHAMLVFVLNTLNTHTNVYTALKAFPENNLASLLQQFTGKVRGHNLKLCGQKYKTTTQVVVLVQLHYKLSDESTS